MEESKRKVMRPLFYREISIDCKFTHQNFLKKGFQTFSSLVLKCQNAAYPREEGITDPKNTTLVKLFKKIKLTKKVDLSKLQILKPTPSLSAFLCIIKRISHVRAFSIYDHRGKETNFKGLFATCPRYMKQLKALDSQIKIQSAAGFLDQPAKVPKEMLFQSDFLRFVPKFEEMKVIFPFYQYLQQMNRVLQFNKYPVSMRKFSLRHPNCRPGALNVSIEHLKELRDLEIVLVSESSFELANSAYNIISKVPAQLQVLRVNFDQGFYIDAAINKAIKRLVYLKKVKLQLSSVGFADNLQILENLKDCPLESLNLAIDFRIDQDILRVKELLSKKKNTLRRLKLSLIKKKGTFESVFSLTELVKAIDNLPQLTNFYFLLRVSKPELKSAFAFKNLFTKPIPLKKFQLISAHLSFSKAEFLDLLNPLQGISYQLEKLRIDIGEFKLESQTDSNLVCEFIRSLVNTRMLKLDNLIVSQQYFPKIIEAIMSLRRLTDVTIGQFFEVPMKVLVSGIGKILERYGLRNFECRIMRSFKQSYEEYNPINLRNIKRKNPYLQIYPGTLVSRLEPEDEIW